MRIIIFCMLASLSAASQNLVINPGAEDLPLGTGWNIVSAGPTACSAAPTNTYNNWTMVPDGSANYPTAHGGTHTFFSGCNTTSGGPYELYQDIDLSAQATAIDAGQLTTIFTGYIQTPVSGQSDAGRFIVDFLDGSAAILGSSYTTAYQSFNAGSGTGWVNYSNTRVAPAGTRTVRIRLQTTIATTPAINAYFDDISFVVASTLPLRLVSFKGETGSNGNSLSWTTSSEANSKHFIVERSDNGSSWTPLGTVLAAGNSSIPVDYIFHDQLPGVVNFYRLKMEDNDGKSGYSHVIKLSRTKGGKLEMKVYPNPVTDMLTLSVPFAQPLNLRIVNSTGDIVLSRTLPAGNNHTIDTRLLASGIYTIELTDNTGRKSTQKFTRL